jgi:hypothetical protein
VFSNFREKWGKVCGRVTETDFKVCESHQNAPDLIKMMWLKKCVGKNFRLNMGDCEKSQVGVNKCLNLSGGIRG